MNCIVIAFENTEQAMAFQMLASRKGLPGRVIPVPRALSAGCGMAWAAPAEKEELIRTAVRGIRTGKTAVMEYDLERRGHGQKRSAAHEGERN